LAVRFCPFLFVLDYGANNQNIEIKQEYDGWNDATEVETADDGKHGHAAKAEDIPEHEQN
jgi:hypothetical protein